MRSTVLLAICILGTTTTTTTSALQLSERKAAPRVVHHEIQRKDVVDPLRRDRARAMRRRDTDDTVNVELENEETLYFMDISVGTPPQDLRMHIDTGSSDLWVNVDSSKLCQLKSDPCQVAGTYDANSSSTYTYLNSDFNISYVDGSGSYGDYAKDTVRFGGIKLANQQFGIGYQSSSLEGIIGIGYTLNEVALTYGYDPYPNIPANLVDHGYISANAYSLWLNDLDASKGDILFGGVNTAKFTGSLETVPVIPAQGGAYAEFVIALTAVGANGQNGNIAADIAVGALLDSGSSLMYLPNDITQKVYNAVGAQYDSSAGAAFVDCALADKAGSLDFTFSGATIQVPLNELVLVAGVQNGQEVCIIGLGPAGDSTPVLGDTFLRSAYVVYDLDNNEISLAQTDFNSTSDDIREITKGSGGVPSATEVNNAVTSVARVSDGARIADGLGGFGSSSSSGAAVARPTAPVGYNVAILGAAVAAGGMFAL